MSDDPLLDVVMRAQHSDRIRHVQRESGRVGYTKPWPDWVADPVRTALSTTGIDQLWEHQRRAIDLVHDGIDVVLATGTGSGKSLSYLIPVLDALHRSGSEPPRGATALYLAPTKALAHDQLRTVQDFDIAGVRATSYDGDTPDDERAWARAHANLIVTNPDMLHHGILPSHRAWASFLRGLNFIIIDESHAYRGVFGSHIALVIRRLLRIATLYKSTPVVICASATTGDPAGSASALIGRPVVAVDHDTSARGEQTVLLWEPPLTEATGENDAPLRRTATAEAATVVADLVIAGARTIAFVRSRRGAEAVAMTARAHLEEVDPSLADTIAAYRAGYLPEERRELEEQLRSGALMAAASTNALELGIDISGLDAVVIAGWPGTRASLRQQLGRAGRAGRSGLGILIARDDPLDTYLVAHPEAIFGREVEAIVSDPMNPYVLGPHLCCAASEHPLTDDDLDIFGPRQDVLAVVDDLTARGLLRRRPTGWYWTDRHRPTQLADLRGTGGSPVRVVEMATGRLLGTVDAGAADASVHAGAIYLHQGSTWLIRQLDLEDAVALAEQMQVDHATHARSITDISIIERTSAVPWGEVTMQFGMVDVTHQVVSFLRRRILTGEFLGEEPLDLPERTLRTKAVWWSIPTSMLVEAGLEDVDVSGAAHAAEHAAIGLLPLFATCDRWDIGGVSTAMHPDTGMCTVFVHDGHPGGAGFAERGFTCAVEWLTATRDAIASCECASGCPSCVQSPKCGNGNEPLDKAGALRLLTVMLKAAPL
jgi:DEAD/DEAH box helicase domain-containing protein